MLTVAGTLSTGFYVRTDSGYRVSPAFATLPRAERERDHMEALAASRR